MKMGIEMAVDGKKEHGMKVFATGTVRKSHATAQEIQTAVEDFLALAEKEGANLRVQKVNDAAGSRLTVAFDWDFDCEEVGR